MADENLIRVGTPDALFLTKATEFPGRLPEAGGRDPAGDIQKRGFNNAKT